MKIYHNELFREIFDIDYCLVKFSSGFTVELEFKPITQWHHLDWCFDNGFIRTPWFDLSSYFFTTLDSNETDT